MAASIATVIRHGTQSQIRKFMSKSATKHLKRSYDDTSTYSHYTQCFTINFKNAFVEKTNISRAISRRSFPYRFLQVQCRTYSSERVCWKCGRKTTPPSELFFCDCGMVQAPASDLDYFSLFGLDVDFDIDTTNLSQMYKDLQKKLHPDKFSQNSEEERNHADQQSSLVNKAYFTLLKPLSRGLYMLDHHGYPIEESTGDVDPEFLMEIMEMNERLDEADSHEMVKELEEEIGSLIQDTIADISAAFRNEDLDGAKKLMIRYQYFGNIEDKIREWYRKHMN